MTTAEPIIAQGAKGPDAFWPPPTPPPLAGEPGALLRLHGNIDEQELVARLVGNIDRDHFPSRKRLWEVGIPDICCPDRVA